MSIERIGSALNHVDDVLGDALDEDLELLRDWLAEADDAVSLEQRKRREAQEGRDGR